MMHNLLCCSLWLLPLLCVSTLAFGQKNPQRIEAASSRILSDAKVLSVDFSADKQTPALIVMNVKNGVYARTNVESLLCNYVQLGNGIDRRNGVLSRLKQSDKDGKYTSLCNLLRMKSEDRNAIFIERIYPNSSASYDIFVNILTAERKKIRIEYVSTSGQLISCQQKEISPGTSRVILKNQALTYGTT